MTDNSLLEDFADETGEHLEELEGCLLRLALAPTDGELLNTIFRSLHTIKGASEYLGFERIARLSHRLENLLGMFRDGKLTADKVAVDLLIDARDRISELVSQVEATGQESSDIDDLLDRVDALATGSPAPQGQGAPAYGGEADTELFDIFIEQLTAGLEALLETAGRIARREELGEAVKEMTDQVDRLASTANYMGYDSLTAEYDALQAGISAFASQSDAADDGDIGTFLQDTIGSCLKRIPHLFPDASFVTIDRLVEHLLSTECPSPADHQGALVENQDVPADGSAADFDEDLSLSLDLEDDLELDLEDAASSSVLPVDADNSLLEDFADETGEHLEELEGCLLRLESDPTDGELLNTMFRSLHTIKGASEYLGFERIARLSHRLENLLGMFRDGKLTADKVAVDLLIDARDRISELVSQVEATGQESSDIDDLLDRVNAIATGSPAPQGQGAPAYGGEADTELFDIFIEQLTAGLEALLETAGRIARREELGEAVKEMADQVDRLASTANYMGYDSLTAEYDALQAGISAFASRSDAADDGEIGTFLQDTFGITFANIQQLFPDAEALAAIDTTILNPAAAEEPAAEAAEEIDATPLSDLDQLLEGLPAIDNRDRENLLSKSLDETFATMQSGDQASDTDDDSQAEQDPIGIQLSPDVQETDAAPAQTDSAASREATPSIFDDFIEDDNEILPMPLDETVEANQDGVAAGEDDDNADLWPEANEITRPVPDDDSVPAPQNVPVIDFSAPPASESKPEEDAAQDGQAIRSKIRKSIRVDADKVDHLMNQVGELVVNRSAFTQLFDEMRELTNYLNQRFALQKDDQRLIGGLTNRLSDATTILGRVTSELQEQVMKVRMLPISRLFNRYPRLVHDLLREADKKVQLQFRGEETELDRMVIEQLADPMIHIIRNAVDHGIETTEERRRKGKPESGILLLEAYHEGSNVVIEVTDDGKGIDLSRIRQKAVEKNLADREALEKMDQQALIDMIMLPGFSTADQITHTSGRGVGMDVVKRSIEKINGSLIVDTRQDVGTRLRIKIPLTLAIIPAMMIRCAGRHFTVPMSAVEETLRIDPGEIFTVDGSEIMHLREEPLPLVKLSDLLNMRVSESMGGDDRFFVMVVKAGAGRTGFIVDALLGRQEVVIKPMDDYLQEDSGFSGATILGDGGISLVLNVDELVLMARERETERKLAAALL